MIFMLGGIGSLFWASCSGVCIAFGVVYICFVFFL